LLIDAANAVGLTVSTNRYCAESCQAKNRHLPFVRNVHFDNISVYDDRALVSESIELVLCKGYGPVWNQPHLAIVRSRRNNGLCSGARSGLGFIYCIAPGGENISTVDYKSGDKDERRREDHDERRNRTPFVPTGHEIARRWSTTSLKVEVIVLDDGNGKSVRSASDTSHRTVVETGSPGEKEPTSTV
jgi:hypothetical protein